MARLGNLSLSFSLKYKDIHIKELFLKVYDQNMQKKGKFVDSISKTEMINVMFLCSVGEL